MDTELLLTLLAIAGPILSGWITNRQANERHKVELERQSAQAEQSYNREMERLEKEFELERQKEKEQEDNLRIKKALDLRTDYQRKEIAKAGELIDVAERYFGLHMANEIIERSASQPLEEELEKFIPLAVRGKYDECAFPVLISSCR